MEKLLENQIRLIVTLMLGPLSDVLSIEDQVKLTGGGPLQKMKLNLEQKERLTVIVL